jgi:hypothetical protein
MRRGGVGGLVVAVGVLVALSGCASDRRSGEATTAARRFTEAVRQHDGATACALLSPPALAEVTRDGPCAAELLRLGLRSGPPTSATVWGDAAQVRAAPDTIFLSEYAAGWRVTGAGCRWRGDGLPYECELGGG